MGRIALRPAESPSQNTARPFPSAEITPYAGDGDTASQGAAFSGGAIACFAASSFSIPWRHIAHGANLAGLVVGNIDIEFRLRARTAD
jgi:hypothetical protein